MREVGKSFGVGPAAVEKVDMNIREGELVSFVGPSGCGKSTLFRLIAGLSQQSEGAIEIIGEDPGLARKRNAISYVFQDATLLPWSNVWDNITLPLKLRHVSKQVQKVEAERVLELVGLQDYAKALPRQLSGGMKMRVSIARALISHPKLLLMDEPFGALDEITRQSLQNELLEIWRKSPGMTILFVTHNVFEAVFLSTRIAVMTPRPGRISRWVDVPVDYPRDERFRTTSDFGRYIDSVSSALHHGNQAKGGLG
nr:ABC transporter ATP-binding protein [Cohnella abietis]